MSDWPKHPDGRPMKMGELSREQQREQFQHAAEKVGAEFESPAMQEAIERAKREAEDRAAFKNRHLEYQSKPIEQRIREAADKICRGEVVDDPGVLVFQCDRKDIGK